MFVNYFSFFYLSAPPLSLLLELNTTRLPNVKPYNTFTINCTAIVPEGVVYPKTFEWSQRRNQGRWNTLIHGREFSIMEVNTSQDVSKSILQVEERRPGQYNYRCNVSMSELGVHNSEMLTDAIHVVGELVVFV